MSQYTKKELLNLFEKLPPQLKETMLSEETADSIFNIAKRHNIEKKVSQLAKKVGEVLLGILPPKELPKVLIEETGIDEETAEKILFEVTRLILYPVKASLSEIYKGIQFAPGGKITKAAPVEEKTKAPKEKEEIEQEKRIEKKEAPSKDTYREIIENE